MHSSGGSLAGMPYLRKTFDTSGKSPAQFYHSTIFYAAPSRGAARQLPLLASFHRNGDTADGCRGFQTNLGPTELQDHAIGIL